MVGIEERRGIGRHRSDPSELDATEQAASAATGRPAHRLVGAVVAVVARRAVLGPIRDAALVGVTQVAGPRAQVLIGKHGAVTGRGVAGVDRAGDAVVTDRLVADPHPHVGQLRRAAGWNRQRQSQRGLGPQRRRVRGRGLHPRDDRRDDPVLRPYPPACQASRADADQFERLVTVQPQRDVDAVERHEPIQPDLGRSRQAQRAPHEPHTAGPGGVHADLITLVGPGHLDLSAQRARRRHRPEVLELGARRLQRAEAREAHVVGAEIAVLAQAVVLSVGAAHTDRVLVDGAGPSVVAVWLYLQHVDLHELAVLDRGPGRDPDHAEVAIVLQALAVLVVQHEGHGRARGHRDPPLVARLHDAGVRVLRGVDPIAPRRIAGRKPHGVQGVRTRRAAALLPQALGERPPVVGLALDDPAELELQVVGGARDAGDSHRIRRHRFRRAQVVARPAAGAVDLPAALVQGFGHRFARPVPGQGAGEALTGRLSVHDDALRSRRTRRRLVLAPDPERAPVEGAHRPVVAGQRGVNAALLGYAGVVRARLVVVAIGGAGVLAAAVGLTGGAAAAGIVRRPARNRAAAGGRRRHQRAPAVRQRHREHQPPIRQQPTPEVQRGDRAVGQGIADRGHRADRTFGPDAQGGPVDEGHVALVVDRRRPHRRGCHQDLSVTPQLATQRPGHGAHGVHRRRVGGERLGVVDVGRERTAGIRIEQSGAHRRPAQRREETGREADPGREPLGVGADLEDRVGPDHEDQVLVVGRADPDGDGVADQDRVASQLHGGAAVERV